MTIVSTLAALQTRHAALSGVTSAPVAYPTSIPAAQLPLVLVDPARAKTGWDSHGGDLAISERLYRVRVFVLPSAQGQGIDQGKQAAIALLDTFLSNYINASPTLTTSAAIQTERDIEDTGVVDNLMYGETSYYGFTIVLPVEERDE